MMANEIWIAAMLFGLRKYRACHSIGVDAQNEIGPLLYGIGRKCGSVSGYSYSEANRNCPFTWNEAVFLDYIKYPEVAFRQGRDRCPEFVVVSEAVWSRRPTEVARDPTRRPSFIIIRSAFPSRNDHPQHEPEVDPRNHRPQESESTATDEAIQSGDFGYSPGATGSAQGAASWQAPRRDSKARRFDYSDRNFWNGEQRRFQCDLVAATFPRMCDGRHACLNFTPGKHARKHQEHQYHR
jgi:hypothetical protein